MNSNIENGSIILNTTASGEAMHQKLKQKHFLSLFQRAAVGVIIIGADGRIEKVNKYAESLFGYAADELVGRQVECLIPGRYRNRHESHRNQFVQHPESMQVCPENGIQAVCKDGREFKAELSLGYLKDKEHLFYIAFINDINDRKTAEDTIRQLKLELDQRVKESTQSLLATVDQLSKQIRENERKDAELQLALEKEKELSQLKSRFVSIASHEFRTPLSGILASAYLLTKYSHESDQPQREKHIKRIMSSVNLLNEVLSDFLSLDKIEQENFKPNITIFDFNVLAQEVIQDLHHSLRVGQTVRYTHSGECDIAYLDRSMLRHIINNLLSNSIKYSPVGGLIDLEVEQTSHHLTIRVRDKGIGIPKKEQGELFKRFFRSSNALHLEGTGLGLNIVKKYVDVLDGTMECISEENEGTEFIVRFKNQQELYENDTDSRG